MKRLLLAAAVVSLLATNSWGAIRLNSSRSNNCREYPNAAVVTGTVDPPARAKGVKLRVRYGVFWPRILPAARLGERTLLKHRLPLCSLFSHS